ncbi:MAG: hypothetical protein PVH25_00530 [Burkholderiales bacterium]|jgi:hypothetical protein
MSQVFHSLEEWTETLSREYPGVQFQPSEKHPKGLNAITAGVLVGRYHSERNPAFGVVFDQPRSCGGRN